MVYYKIVHKNESNILSSWVVTSHKYHTIYRINEWIKPHTGKLFVFKNLQIAREYDRFGPNKAIFECEVKNPVEGKYRAYVTDEDMDLFWENFETLNPLKFFTNYVLVPIDTFYCDEVKLIREVT